MTLDNSTSQAFVAGGSTATGGTVDVLATTTNTANTTANSTATGAGPNSAIQNILAGKVDPGYLASATPSNPNPADKTSPADTAFSGGLPLGVAGAVAVTKFTPTTQAYVDSSTVTADNAINIDASSNNNTATTADGDSTTSNASCQRRGRGRDQRHRRRATRPRSRARPARPACQLRRSMSRRRRPRRSRSDAERAQSPRRRPPRGRRARTSELAGALALNIVSNTSEASVPSGSTVSMAGDVTFNAQDTRHRDQRRPAAGRVRRGHRGQRVGVGAAVALTIASNTTLADLENTAQLTGAKT